jgi:isoleucyl-tRNA synthetase
VFVHGFAVDEKGQKMSKSLGNITLPKDIINKFGVDALRWWVSAHATQHNTIPVSNKLLESSLENVNKIRATLKFMLGFIEQNNGRGYQAENDNNLLTIDRFVLHNLFVLHEQVQTLYNTYQYNRVSVVVNNFIVNNLSSLYIHLIKDRLYCGTNEQHALLCDILKSCFDVLSKCLWPIVPFIVEESWSYQSKTAFVHSVVDVLESWKNPQSVDVVQTCLELRKEFFQLANDVNSWTLKLEISIPAGEKLDLFKVKDF